MKIQNKNKFIDDHIDDVIVQHLQKNNDPQKYGEYVDLAEYERHRIVLKRCYNRRQQRSAQNHQMLNSDYHQVSISQQLQNCLQTHSRLCTQNEQMLTSYFFDDRDKNAALQFTSGKPLSALGYTERSLKKQNFFRPNSMKKKRLMSALGTNLSEGESAFKAALHIERSLRVSSCDFAGIQSTKPNTEYMTEDHYGDTVKPKPAKMMPADVTQFLEADLVVQESLQTQVTNNESNNKNISLRNVQQSLKSSLKQRSQKRFQSQSTELKGSVEGAKKVHLNTQAAENVKQSLLRQIQNADPMVSNFSQNLFKSERENHNYYSCATAPKNEESTLSPSSKTFGKTSPKLTVQIPQEKKLHLNFDHLLNKPIVLPSADNVDTNKVKFLEEIRNLLTKAEEYYKQQMHIQLCNCISISAFFVLQVKEFILAMKMYSICGEMLVKHNQLKLAIVMYTKLLNATQTETDQPSLNHPEFKLYAYKQIAFCYLKMKEYDLALKTLLKELQLAWVVNSYTAETNIYEQMALCYYYKGDLKKSGYYNNRFLRGVTEAQFSRVRKICVIQSKDLNHYLLNPPKDFDQIKTLFSAHLQDYNLTKQSLVQMLKEFNFFTSNEQFATTLFNPDNQMLNQSSPIQTPRAQSGEQIQKKGLPSPSTVNSDKNALLFSSLQVLKKKEIIQRKQLLDKARKDAREKLVRELGVEQASLIPDSELLLHEPDLHEMEKIFVIMEDDNAHLQRCGPMVVLHFQKIRQKLKTSDVKNAIQENGLRTKAQKEAMRLKKMSTNLKDIKERAQMYNSKKPCDKISLRHATSKRRTGQRFEQISNFQIERDLNSFKEELIREQKVAYVCEEGAAILKQPEEKLKINILGNDLKYYSQLQQKNQQ